MKEKVKKALEKVLQFSHAQQTEVLIYYSSSQVTRFANNTIHQNVAEENVNVSVRVIEDKRIGHASSNNLKDKSLKEVVEKATQNAKFAPRDPHFYSLPQKEIPRDDIVTFFPETAASSPEKKANDIEKIIKLALKEKLIASGAYRTITSVLGVANSLGIKSIQDFTKVSLNLVIMSDTSSGFSSFVGENISLLDGKKLAQSAIKKALESKKPIKIEPGQYDVILEPDAVSNMLAFLAYAGLGALSVQEGRSFLCGKFGQKIMNENITIWDDGLAPETLKLPFDFEGVPKKKIVLIEKGIAKRVVYDSYTAHKEKIKSTGHALPYPNSVGPLPLNLFMKEGEASLEEMIASTDKGLLITRFHYTNLENPTLTILTGMTRDGTFLIEKGKVTKGVKNLRFTQSILEAFSNVKMISKERSLKENMTGVAFVPALKIKNFNFSGTTQF